MLQGVKAWQVRFGLITLAGGAGLYFGRQADHPTFKVEGEGAGSATRKAEGAPCFTDDGLAAKQHAGDSAAGRDR